MSHPENEGRIKVGITCGDVNGVGLEVVMKALLDNRVHQIFTPVIYASNKLISHQRKHLNLNDFQYNTVRSSSDIILRKTNVINCWEEEIPVEWGKATEISGKYALQSLEAAVADLKAGHIHVLVTAPINKHTIQSKDFTFQGHTEYLANRFETPEPLMFLVSDTLRVAVYSGHIPVKEVASVLSEDQEYGTISQKGFRSA